MRMLLLLLFLNGVVEADTPKVIDYKLQFEMRTLELQQKHLQAQMEDIKKQITEKVKQLQTACEDKKVSLNEQLEFVCVENPPPAK
jgi:Skp family chaperone for outer membrane proteins